MLYCYKINCFISGRRVEFDTGEDHTKGEFLYEMDEISRVA